ncbi:MAG: hypothetical protein NTV34_17865 [Proteobacteria bacterium]|nr:hypothetical protein [Pseudomonadota bacterium]
MGITIGKDNLLKVVHGESVEVKIDVATKKVEFLPEPTSSLILVRKFESYEKIYLDKVMALIYKDATKVLSLARNRQRLVRN